MTTEQKFKWAMTGLIVMVLLNAITLAILWFNQPVSQDWRNSHGDERSTIHQHIQRELGLTEEQAKSIQELREEHFGEMRNLRQSLDQQRGEYFNFIMSDESGDQAKRDSLLDELTRQFSKTERAMYQHMTEMKNVLDEEQQEKFQQMMERSFARQHHRGRGNNR